MSSDRLSVQLIESIKNNLTDLLVLLNDRLIAIEEQIEGDLRTTIDDRVETHISNVANFDSIVKDAVRDMTFNVTVE